MKKIFFIVLILAVAGLLAWGLRALSRHQDRTDQPDTKTTRAELRDIEETMNATGEVTPARRTPVKSEVSGRIAKLHAALGDTVRQGHLLVELDRSELISQKEELLRAGEAAELRLEKSGRDFERMKGLHEQGFATDKDFQDAETEKRLAENNLEIERARLQTLEEKLTKTSIRAPQDGVVIVCDVEDGEVIVGANSAAQGTVIMEVADLTRLLIKADINEVDVVRLSNAAPVELTFDSVPGVTAPGSIRAISPAAKVNTSDGVRTFPVEIVCDSVDLRIRPGITANVTVPLSAVSQAVAVVVSAVFADGTNRVAFLKKDGDFEQVPVTVGINDAQFVEVKSGLAVGDEIALTRPPAFAKPESEKDYGQMRRGRRVIRRR